jgi:hypothetical protein
MVATSAPTAPPSASANLSSIAFSEGGGYGGQVAVNAEREERAAKSFSPEIFTSFAFFCCSSFSSQIVDFSPSSEPQELAG